MISQLQKLWLSNEESKVYLACLELWSSAVSIIAKRSGVHRVSCYHTLDKLLKKRLVSQYTKWNTKYFQSEKPEQLLKIEEEKVNIAKLLQPQLNSIINTFWFKPKIRFYEWRHWVEKVFNESLETKWEILWYSNLKNVTEFFPKFFEDYTHKRFKRKIKARYLSSDIKEWVELIIPFLPQNYDKALLEILLVNKDQFPLENEILIFNNMVWIVSLNKNELLGLIVESPSFSKTMKSIFDLAWLWATAFVAK